MYKKCVAFTITIMNKVKKKKNCDEEHRDITSFIMYVCNVHTIIVVVCIMRSVNNLLYGVNCFTGI